MHLLRPEQPGVDALRFRGRPVGYLTHVAGRGGPAQAYRETVELAVAAEELGFGSFWVAQHHAGALQGLLPSPLVLLAAVAERTSRIRLGTAVVAAALEDPRRLAEDAAVVDTLSGGRLELGVGAGADPAASAVFGRDHDLRHADCARVVDALRAELEGSWLVPAAAGLRGRLWWATASAAGIDAAAERGIGVLTGRPAHLPGVAEDLARYRLSSPGARVAMCRILAEGESVAPLLQRWTADRALPAATELLVQTQPATAGFAAHLRTLRSVARTVRGGTAAGERTGAGSGPRRGEEDPR
ncbi:LLM class flavin-dependent oxidoreductase [Pseudonocardia lacus]|uniref:LLM class flavin-dependent oxidoreductase n=1 Tax=Pseudonocardia lacus TaxID=2835865 RepID=UPI001BDBB3FA|nr:LLM class flavin-dependent oxidoreductase [Pseudonocardia lacus]